MAITIPSAVFTKYQEFADGMISNFGITCQLVYTEKIEEITDTVPRAKQRRSLNVQDRNDSAGFARGSKIQTIGYLTDLPKLNKAKALIANKDVNGYEEYRFVKAAEPIPYGLQQNRYVVCFWSRA